MANPKTSQIIQSIENILLEILNSEPPRISLRNWKVWENWSFSDRLILRNDKKMIEKYVRFDDSRTRFTFTVVVHLLAKIYKMLLNNVYYTKREIYYEEIEVVQNMQVLDYALRIIYCLLNCPPWELGIMSTSKGLVAGPLLIKADSKNVINCSSPGGTSIPYIVCSPTVELRSSAKYVLLVEKDAIFQRLLNENVLSKLDGSLLITGKGFPDISTRMLVNKLNKDLKLPVLALVDADPFGIAIMCVYRFGSMNAICGNENLITPEIRWLGIHPSDLLHHDLTTLPFQEVDFLKLQKLSKTIYIKSHKKLLKQINILFALGRKAEIEAVCDFSAEYLTNVYIPGKIIKNQLY